MKKLLGLLLLLLTYTQIQAEETLFFPTPGTEPGQPVKMEFRPVPDVKIIGIKMVFEGIALPKKGGEEKTPQKDEKPVPQVRKVEQVAFWEKPSGKLGIFEFKIGEPAQKGMFASGPLLVGINFKF